MTAAARAHVDSFDVAAEAERAVRLIHPPGHVVELRALGVEVRRGYRATVSGYYDDPAKLAADAAALSGKASGVYITMNEIDPALLARAANRPRTCGRDDATTSDRDVRRRRWLLVDVDGVRVKGVSASEAELEAALDRARVIRGHLAEEDWPEPIEAVSGNGAHLLYPIDLPPEDGGTVKRVLEALAAKFNGSGIKVDTAVHNPARIVKLYGTLSMKGDSTDERPHRHAHLIGDRHE
jgi:hypothetical protein